MDSSWFHISRSQMKINNQTTQSNIKKKLFKFKHFIYLRRWVACGILISILLLALLLWTFLTSNSVIVGGGSTSVAPLFENNIDSYQNNAIDSPPIMYNAIGSSAALTGLRNESYVFGMLSDPVTDSQAKSYWETEKIARFAVAKDHFVFVYHLPNGAKLKEGSVVIKDNVSATLHLNVGHNKNGNILIPLPVGELTAQQTMTHMFVDGDTWNNIFPGQFATGGDETPFRLSREPGSGTQSFFVKQILNNQSFIPNRIVTSNGEMLDTIMKTPNSFGYIDFAFAREIMAKDAENINVAGMETSTYEKGVLPYIESNEQDIIPNNNYDLDRPFVGLVNTNSKMFYETSRFLAWMINPYPYERFLAMGDNPINTTSAAHQIIDTGEVPLTENDSIFQTYNTSSIKNFFEDYAVPLYKSKKIPGKNNDLQSLAADKNYNMDQYTTHVPNLFTNLNIHSSDSSLDFFNKGLNRQKYEIMCSLVSANPLLEKLLKKSPNHKINKNHLYASNDTINTHYFDIDVKKVNSSVTPQKYGKYTLTFHFPNDATDVKKTGQIEFK